MGVEIKVLYSFSQQQLCPQNMGKAYFNSTENVWENINIPNSRVSYIFHMFRNPYNSQNMGRKIFHSIKNFWKNTNIPKVWASYIFCVEQKSIHLQKHGKSELPQYQKSTGQHTHSKIMGFLNISREAELHTISKTSGK